MIEDYLSIERAFKFYNEKIFDGQLQPTAFTIARQSRMIACFRPISFVTRQGGEEMSEISFNPDYLDRTVEEIVSTLVHEMFHLAQYQYGDPSRNGYHNKEWGSWMEKAGLTPSSTGQEGGKRTGQKMSHVIIPEGLFEVVTKQLVGDNFKLKWCSVVAKGAVDPDDDEDGKPKKKKAKSKLKYTCPECKQNAWAKPDTPLMCGKCKLDMECEEVE
jgi:predicted SprT family Zn-dependent metalloprotease